MYEQVYEPIAGNLAISMLVAVIPIVVLFVLLAGLRMAAQWASLISAPPSRASALPPTRGS